MTSHDDSGEIGDFERFKQRIDTTHLSVTLHCIRDELKNVKGLSDLERAVLNEAIGSRFCQINAAYVGQQKARW